MQCRASSGSESSTTILTECSVQAYCVSSLCKIAVQLLGHTLHCVNFPYNLQFQYSIGSVRYFCSAPHRAVGESLVSESQLSINVNSL